MDAGDASAPYDVLAAKLKAAEGRAETLKQQRDSARRMCRAAELEASDLADEVRKLLEDEQRRRHEVEVRLAALEGAPPRLPACSYPARWTPEENAWAKAHGVRLPGRVIGQAS